MAATDPQPTGPSGSPSPGPPVRFIEGDRVRWRLLTGTIVLHRGVPYVLFDHHRDPPAAAYAVTKLERIAPVRPLSDPIGGGSTAAPR